MSITISNNQISSSYNYTHNVSEKYSPKILTKKTTKNINKNTNSFDEVNTIKTEDLRKLISKDEKKVLTSVFGEINEKKMLPRFNTNNLSLFTGSKIDIKV